MSIFEKVLNLLKQNRLCPYCVGRMFSLLGTNTTNLERANSVYLSLTMENHKLYLSGDKNNRDLAIKKLKILAEQANFITAQKILEKEGLSFSEELSKENCYLCQGIFEF
jgi:tRNA U54 and U55 pseudouridine synthase Pus10